MSWIGIGLDARPFVFDQPSIDAFNFDLSEIGISLARIARWTGNGRYFVSVATHTVAMNEVAQMARRRDLLPEGIRVTRKTRRAILLHDAEEACTSDIPRPYKMLLDSDTSLHRQVATWIKNALYAQFDVPVGNTRIEDTIAYFDLLALSVEWTLQFNAELPADLVLDPVLYPEELVSRATRIFEKEIQAADGENAFGMGARRYGKAWQEIFDKDADDLNQSASEWDFDRIEQLKAEIVALGGTVPDPVGDRPKEREERDPGEEPARSERP